MTRAAASRTPWIVAALLLATAIAYEPVRHNGFVDFDDGVYLVENPRVQDGLTAEAFVSAFELGYAGNWHPLTWISHAIDVSLYGLDPVGHHVTNVVLHAASAVALFFLARRWTGREGAAAFVAALFALHPLHVESVAWAAERKDVLSALLGFLALLAWTAWRDGRSRAAYALSLALFAAGLLAKPMLVSLPVLLVLLERFPLVPRPAGARRGRLAIEVAPFVLLAAVSCAVTFEAQRRGGAVAAIEALPWGTRVGNALASTAAYLGKAVVPTRLAVFYPYPEGGIPVGRLLLAGAVVVGLSALALLRARSRPWLALGWGWYLATLLPVIGLVQVGQQAMADRYTYLPLVGPSIAVALEVPRWIGGKLATALGLVAALGWSAATRAQVARWKDDRSLFGHAVAVTGPNALARYRLGYALAELGLHAEALAEYRAALAIRPRYADPHNNIGQLEEALGRPADALASYDRAIALDPGLAAAHANRGNALDELGRAAEAERSYLEAIRLDPSIPEVHNDFGVALAKQGRTEEAVERFREAIRRKPRYGSAHLNLARALSILGRHDEALRSLAEGVRLEPGRTDARAELEALLRARSGG